MFTIRFIIIIAPPLLRWSKPFMHHMVQSIEANINYCVKDVRYIQIKLI